MAAQEDDDALHWLRSLCEEGRFVPTDCDSDTPAGPPDGFDSAKFARGQRVAMDNIFSLAYAELVSMLMMFAFEDQTVALLSTGKSDTPSKAYFRYLSTMRRVRSWYEGDIWDPKSAACKNIKSVRGMHDLVARRLAADPTSATCPSGLSLHVRASCPLGPADGASAWAAVDSEEPPVLNQRAMAVTQVAFVGLFILAPGCFGAHCVTEDDLEALVYVWWVLGGALGVQDRYNACGGWKENIQEKKTLAQNNKIKLRTNPEIKSYTKNKHIEN
ncbi:uncharacterized protein LOC117644640 [Thrips palmi]|uniref:Uncharacterized protein LOC117644640 n=1 Tax=Thrips palmi TaxID=161013 RepID=A0A6P8Z0Q0_THRPL|nr:uncharacterized protein LOC117644640 [Thrips palmi]